ncbi:MAG: TIR domain-containing protein [Rhodospirillaceae bacterium]|nr:TIR domain-containing protein [Rhodospirillaceae bacterium]
MAGAARYRAFISYSHADTKQARWLHRALESYRVPARLVGRETATGVIGKRIGAIFRDRDELPVAADLSGEINQALDASQFLIVLCSPKSAQSKWVNQEVINFKRLKGASSIIAVIVAGEPFAGDDTECFCPGLRFQVGDDGRLSGTPAEPIAADLRPGKDAPRLVKMKVLAGLLGVGLDELIRRDNARRQKLTAYAMAASLVGMAVMTALAWSAVVSRNDAERRGRKAEALMEFMLKEMKVPLRDYGRLKVFNEAVDRTVGYYADENIASLADESISRYGRALHLEIETRRQEGKLDEAAKLAAVAAEMTGTVLRRAPMNPERNSDHGQSEFWLGNLSLIRGDAKQAVPHFEAYAELAELASKLKPEDPYWQADAARARSSLGAALFRVGELERASREFAISNAAWSRIRQQRPDETQAQQESANTLSLTSDVLKGQDRMMEAYATQLEGLALAEPAYALNKNDRDAQYRLANLERRTGRLAFEVGETARAFEHLERATALGSDLLQREPKNASWQDSLALSVTDLAAAALLTGDDRRAAAELARKDLAQILEKPADPGDWTIRLQAQLAARAVKARLAATQSDAQQDFALVEKSVRDLATLGDAPPLDAIVFTGETEIALGDGLAQKGSADAMLHWRNAARLKDRPLGLRGAYTAMQALCREGDHEAVAEIATRLKAAGYLRPLNATVSDKCGN